MLSDRSATAAMALDQAAHGVPPLAGFSATLVAPVVVGAR